MRYPQETVPDVYRILRPIHGRGVVVVIHGSSNRIGPILFVFVTTVGFAIVALTIGRRLSTKGFATLQRMGSPEPATSLTITVLLGLLFGAFTHKLGVHALFGFFIAGVVVGAAKSVSEQTRGIISQIV